MNTLIFSSVKFQLIRCRGEDFKQRKYFFSDHSLMQIYKDSIDILKGNMCTKDNKHQDWKANVLWNDKYYRQICLESIDYD